MGTRTAKRSWRAAPLHRYDDRRRIADDHFDAAVLLAAAPGLVVRDRLMFALSGGGDPPRVNAPLHQERFHGIRAALRKSKVGVVASDVVGVALDLDAPLGDMVEESDEREDARQAGGDQASDFQCLFYFVLSLCLRFPILEVPNAAEVRPACRLLACHEAAELMQDCQQDGAPIRDTSRLARLKSPGPNAEAPMTMPRSHPPNMTPAIPVATFRANHRRYPGPMSALAPPPSSAPATIQLTKPMCPESRASTRLPSR